ncbi:MAG: DUF364 domain-containing protein [Desulfobacteraceae bacterium]|nr:DUF364 domain-containing protein [Desulfobacteraceae bacterium]
MNRILCRARDFLKLRVHKDLKIKEIVFNPNFTGVQLDNHDAGVAMNIRLGSWILTQDIEPLIGKNAFEVLSLLENSQGPLMASVQVALINALSKPLMSPEFLSENGYDAATDLENHSIKEMVKDDTVVIVGFSSNIVEISSTAKKVYVSELAPQQFQSHVINSHGVLAGPSCAELIHSDDANKAFAKADTVILTGCTLVTETMEFVLGQCKEKQVLVYGVTASFFPKPLFDLGVDAVTTAIFHNGDAVMDSLTNYGPMAERFFKQASQKFFIQKSK